MKHFRSGMLVLFLLLLSPNRSKGIRSLMEEQSLNSKHYLLHEDSSKSHDMISKETRPPTPTTMRKYPDMLDIAGMDYSPAKRKPPIHN